MKTTTPRLDAAWLEAKKGANAAYEQRDALSMLEHETRADLLDAQRSLATYAARLAFKMKNLASRLEIHGGENDAEWLNALGETGSDADDVNRLCAQIAKMRETLRGIASARKAAARPADGSPS